MQVSLPCRQGQRRHTGDRAQTLATVVRTLSLACLVAPEIESSPIGDRGESPSEGRL
jgi:hypothetical protein